MAVSGEVQLIFEKLSKQFLIKKVYSHYETGIDITYKRDKKMAKWFVENKIRWYETVSYTHLTLPTSPHV